MKVLLSVVLFIQGSVVVIAVAPTITLTLEGHTKTTANISLTTSDSSYSSATFNILEYNCTDGSGDTVEEDICVVNTSDSLTELPVGVYLSGLVPGKEYSFEAGAVEYYNGSGTPDNDTDPALLTPFCTTPNPPANLTVTDGGSVTSVAYTVINNTVGVNDGYVVKYFQWNGTGFIEVGEDNNTGASYSETGSFSGLTKGDLYKLKAYADDECSEYELSTEDVIAYYQAGLDTPTTDLTLLLKNESQMCFIWQYSGAGNWNMVKVELVQSGQSKGTESKSVSSSPGIICVTQSGADTSMDAEVHFSAGNEVSADGITFTEYSDSRNNSFYNFSDFSIVSDFSSDCDMDIENCSVTVIVDYSINPHADYIYVNLSYTSGSTVSESERFNLTDCSQSGVTDYNCSMSLYSLDKEEYDFDVNVMIYDELFKTIDIKRGDRERIIGMRVASLLTMVFSVMAAFN
ncbi:uncharacterized protein LOC142342214 isoform X2 [Convolutriloba macropyga]|uniref:uncharacterized protein LOC142342214 isoform X2 n=1 Tax=Convolutriloba macropyga TaxID=536237 RepID=UPI003F520B8B